VVSAVCLWAIRTPEPAVRESEDGQTTCAFGNGAKLYADVTFLGVPLTQMCVEAFERPKERLLLKNICYAGVLVALLAIDIDIVSTLLDETFAKNERLRESNQRALRMGYDYAREHLTCPLPFHLEAMDATSDSILIDGNTATALGCLYAGATVAA